MEQERKNEYGERNTAPDGAADIHDRLILNLRDMSHIMRAMYEGRGSQKRVLIVLDKMGGCVTQRELTERLGIQPGSASEVIAKLESAGCIRRTPNEADRRTVDVTLTPTGKTLAAEARQQRTRRHAQMFSCLSDDEKSQLLVLLEKVNADWKAHDRGAEAPHAPEGCCHRGQRHFRGE